MYRISLLALPLLLASACSGSQSALSPAGDEAARVVLLSWIMFAGGAAILALVVALTGLSIYGPASWRRKLGDSRMVVALGLIFPVVVLSGLLSYGFIVMQLGMPASHNKGALQVSVAGHQWWWRVTYHHPDGTTTETANELHIPVGKPVELRLTTADVLHSFWVPAHAGKVDMVPGRTNRLRFTALEAGLARGQCAEYCGGAHALMAFYVVAMPPSDFAQWMENQRADATENMPSELAERGEGLFLDSGCGACHTIRGTGASGLIGPDLTHVGSRLSIGAALLPNGHDAIASWLTEHQAIKPGNHMPPYDFLSETQREALAAYLAGLE